MPDNIDSDFTSSSNNEENREKIQSNLRSLSPRENKIEIDYHKFRKRGNNNIPLRNIKQLEVIKARKAAER